MVYDGILFLDPERRSVSGDTDDRLFASSLWEECEPERIFRVVSVSFGVRLKEGNGLLRPALRLLCEWSNEAMLLLQAAQSVASLLAYA